MKKLSIITLILFILFGCSNKKEISDEERQKDIIKQRNERIISELSDKYAIRYSLDTIRYDYTIQFDELLETKYQMVKRFEIQDIYCIDSISYVKVNISHFPTYYLLLEISQKDRQKLLSLEKSFRRERDVVMIIELQEIKKMDLEYDFVGESSCSIDIIAADIFLGKGQVIEVLILNKLL